MTNSVLTGKDVYWGGNDSYLSSSSSSPDYAESYFDNSFDYDSPLSDNDELIVEDEDPYPLDHSSEDPFVHKGLVHSSFGVNSNNHYSNSPSSGSERFSHSPSPSPPLTSQPQVKIGVPTTPSTVNVVTNKPSPSIILSGVPHSSKVGVPGTHLQHILLIDSRPYQLIPHQQNEVFSQGSQPFQVRVLPPSQLQQPQALQPQLQLQQQRQNIEASSSNFVNVRTSQNRSVPQSSAQRHETSNCQETMENSEDTEEDVVITTRSVVSDAEYQADQTLNKEFESQEMESGQSSSQETNSQVNDCDCPIPNLLNDSGIYGFKVLLDAKEDTLKTPTWLVSSITNKLYTNMNKPIPFRVVLKKGHQKKKFFLRAMAVFKYPMFLRQNVVRCPNHLNPLDSTNIDFSHSNHVIRADHPRAVYETSPSGRLSVVVPLDFPENRSEAIPVLLKFMCHNSCVGGINRRPMAVLLTLEHNEEEMGRYTVDVRVCACPSRDVKTEEKQLIAKGLYQKTGHHAFESRRNRKRQRKEDDPSHYDEDHIYYLPVRGTTLFNFLQDTKVHYLKHHPEYASKYPDPPIDLSLKMLEDLPQPSSDLPEENQSPDSPSFSKEKGQPVIFVYSNNSDKGSPRVLSDGDLPPDVRRTITESVQMNLPNQNPQVNVSPSAKEILLNIKKEKMSNSYSEDEADEEGSHGRVDFDYGPFVPQLAMEKLSKRASKGELLRSSSNRTPNGKHKSKMSLNRTQQQRHLQVASMPEKQKGNLVRILSKQSEEAERSKLQLALEGSRANVEAINENEKVMLAAQVLASHLGAHQIDK